jgi:hypothetical protein
MTSAERQRAIAYLEETRERLLQTTSALTCTQLQHKAVSDRWSIGEILEHLVFSEQRGLSRIQHALQQSVSVPKGSWEDEALVQAIAGRVTRVSAPEALLPTGRWPAEQLLEQFLAARASTIDFTRTTTGELRQHLVDHPLFGPLDCYQLLMAIPAHCERHRLQAEEVLSATGFPREATV